MVLSWNEIRANATQFSLEWANETSEDAEAKTFWDEFFRVFGVNRKRIAAFEKSVKKLDGRAGFIDVFWSGTLLAEHKSRRKNLDAAHTQATDYFHGLKDHELPKYVVVSDFARIRLYDLDQETDFEFELKDFPSQVERFGFIAGYQKRVFREQDPVNVKAAMCMARLHEALEASRYSGHDLEMLLVRLLFCLFADDTGIFEQKGSFYELILETREDGSDLGRTLSELFEVLNTPEQKRQVALDERFQVFPYVNGQLFAERLGNPSFSSKMRDELLKASVLDWGMISPAIFGSLFQGVMDAEERRKLGAHYTSEANIFKALEPLFLEELRAEFVTAKNNPRKLETFIERLRGIRILDPACGCGNFLILAYRELRRLELEAVAERLRLLNSLDLPTLDISTLLHVGVEQFNGFEYEEFPAQIAKVAMWLTDHQMNLEASAKLGQHFIRLPLTTAANIVQGDALDKDWAASISLESDKNARELYIVGNPPFIGSKYMSDAQRDSIKSTFQGVRDNGILDYVTGWYAKAVKMLREWRNRKIRMKFAFVSTNSITQGEQVAPLWETLLGYGIHIHFAHRTFKWSNDARGKAAVHCVIIGFGLETAKPPRLFEYDKPDSDAHEIPVLTGINPYLVDAPMIVVRKQQHPLSAVPEIYFGNMPLDGGHLLLTPEERDELLRVEPNAKKYIKPLLDSQDFINGHTRYCLWLVDADPSELRKLPKVLERVEKVKQMRLASKAPSTQKFAATPTLFRDRRLPAQYVAIPGVSSERRDYVPIGFLNSTTVVNNLLFMIPNADMQHFGILTSRMHMAWLAQIGGRLESRFRYSKDIVYNTFPFPSPTPKQKTAIETAAQAVLEARQQFPKASLADLYDPNTMPPVLRQAHTKLDKAVEASYGKTFNNDRERLEFLLTKYEHLLGGLMPSTPSPKKRTKKSSQ